MLDIDKEVDSIIQDSIGRILEGEDLPPSFFLFYSDGRKLAPLIWDDPNSNKYNDSRRVKIAVLSFKPDCVISMMEARIYEEEKPSEEVDEAFLKQAREKLKDREFDSLVLTVSKKDSGKHRVIIYNTKSMKKLKDDQGIEMSGLIGDPYELYELSKSFKE